MDDDVLDDLLYHSDEDDEDDEGNDLDYESDDEVESTIVSGRKKSTGKTSFHFLILFNVLCIIMLRCHTPLHHIPHRHGA